MDVMFKVTFLAMIGILFISILFHELGHLIAFKLLKNIDIEIRLSKKGITTGHLKDYYMLTPAQRITQNFIAILFGAMPLFLIPRFSYWGVFFLAYLCGCITDINNIREDYKKMGAL